MPSTEWIRQYLLQNRASARAGLAHEIDYVGVKGNEIIYIKFKPYAEVE